MNNENTILRSEDNVTEETLSLLEIAEKYLRHWRWLLLSVIVCLTLGYVYARYAATVYESSASVLIQQDNPSAAPAELGMLKDLGLMGGGSVLEDEIELFKSRTLMERVVKDLELNWKYENIGTTTGFVRAELYEKKPIRVRTVAPDSIYYEKSLDFEIMLVSSTEYSITEGLVLAGKKLKFGEVLTTAAGAIIVEKTPDFDSRWTGKSIRITLTPCNKVIGAMQGAIIVEAANKDANIISLRLKGNSVEKNNAVLNSLIAEHAENAITNKNQIVRNTTAFINERMKFIAAELSDVEKVGESYKTEHQLTDVTTDAAIYLEKEGNIEKQVVETTIEMNLADFVNEFIREQHGYDQLLPANLGFKDASVAQMTGAYNELVLERNRLKETSGEKHPGVARLESQLGSLRSSLESSLRNLRNSLAIQLRKLESEEKLYQSKIAAVPQFEREYRDILRQQQIKETLYLFLLQKREENEISLAATVANTQVVDRAFSTEIPISPRKSLIYLGTFLLGLIIPIGIIYLRGLFNNKVQSRADVEALGLPVVGEIPEAESTKEHIVLAQPQSGISEAYRVLRANLSFVLPTSDPGGKTISLTSTLAGEGKSFTSVNLAYIFAASGKKVVLIGMDLRKPRLNDYLDIKTTFGLSNYLANNELQLKDILVHSTTGEYTIDVIASGSVPPNPSELLMSHRLDSLVEELRTIYDYIIFDNGPVGLVVDALTTNRLADVTLYLVRANKLDKRALTNTVQLFKSQKLKNMYVLLNAVKSRQGSYHYYGYGYNESTKKKSWLSILLGRKH